MSIRIPGGCCQLVPNGYEKQCNVLRNKHRSVCQVRASPFPRVLDPQGRSVSFAAYCKSLRLVQTGLPVDCFCYLGKLEKLALAQIMQFALGVGDEAPASSPAASW